MKISASFLKSRLNRKDTIDKLCDTNVDYIHVDIMDGLFVDNRTIGSSECIELLKDVNKPIDIHLMCQFPYEYINLLRILKPRYISVHAEIDDDLGELIDLIHSYGIKAGLAVNLNTDADKIKEYLPRLDYIIVMGVEAGAGGQKLVPETLIKGKYYKYLRETNAYHYEICLDGGVNGNNRADLGMFDVLVSGSYICMSDDYQIKVNELR